MLHFTPPTELEEGQLPDVFRRAIDSGDRFEEWYLRQRLDLARREAGERPKHVAVELRKLLSVRKPPSPVSPRLAALAAWARALGGKALQLGASDEAEARMLSVRDARTMSLDLDPRHA